MSDVQHETNILVECVKRGADITRDGIKISNIPSDKIFKETINIKGEVFNIEYKKYSRKNGLTTYK